MSKTLPAKSSNYGTAKNQGAVLKDLKDLIDKVKDLPSLGIKYLMQSCKEELVRRGDEGIKPKDRIKESGLRVHQLRVLRVLGESVGPLSRAKIAEKTETNVTLVTSALGPSDPEKRKQQDTFTNGYPSLRTLELVDEIELDIDGILERAFTLTDKGKEKYQATLSIEIPQPRKR